VSGSLENDTPDMMRPLLFATNYYVVANLQIQWIARMMYFQALSLASKKFEYLARYKFS